MRVKIVVETSSYNIGGEDPDDSWSRDSTHGQVDNVYAVQTTDALQDSYYSNPVKEFDVDLGDNVYAVVVDYESGDTFGRDGGYYQVVDAFDNTEDADVLLALTRAYDTDNGGRNRGYTNVLEYKGVQYYAGWKGYFECTQSIDIWECPVRGSAGKGTGRHSYRKGQ